MELELRAMGEHREVELVLHHWDQLKVNQICIELGEERHTEWQWTLGEVGQGLGLHHAASHCKIVACDSSSSGKHSEVQEHV
ncbi:MAG TPA: hypothetical protein DEQ28_00590 [Clostridiales bacterium]|nr:hypothetical protein [Clostridiales bacterium]